MNNSRELVSYGQWLKMSDKERRCSARQQLNDFLIGGNQLLGWLIFCWFQRESDGETLVQGAVAGVMALENILDKFHDIQGPRFLDWLKNYIEIREK